AMVHHHHHHSAACPSQCSCSGTTVNCQERSLASVPAGIPTTTQVLHLYINQITKLEPGVFDSLTQLTYLNLAVNQLTALPVGVFDKLTKLTHLALHINQLKSIPMGVFDNLKSLTHIYLFNNPWDCECSDILYLKNWIVQHASIVNPLGNGGVDNVKCSGTNTPVRAVTEASTSPSKCP
uniref:Variable lymphocyte receptor B n=1 Tax=Petromyzon marinus TaxID=7757 RepID=UPI000252CB75|nr:Chain D, Variable lymphocyte receptor B [Petromyzon marinus]3TWI_E Chain E, Variable lymphocyte receptor B [Petromyzon marinus]3TWI_F Chain F, Variable lymphocyte receptor B [Petromyzon marinus]